MDKKNTGRGKRTFYIFVLFCVISSCTNSYKYSFSIIDDASGEQKAARVSVTDACGKPLLIDGDPSCVEYLGKLWCYTDGSFTVTSPAEAVEMEIRCGPEILPVKITPEKGSGKQIIKLHRWTTISRKKYMSGDVHIHTPFSSEAYLQMKAEDLNLINILVGDFVDTSHFTGQIDPVSGPGHAIYVAQEVRDWQMGHLTLLGLSSLVPGYSFVGGTLGKQSKPHSLMAHAMDETHRQGGVVLWSHFSNLPGAESPVAVALGKVDALELMTYDDPTQLPSHQSPWNNSGMPRAEFPVMRGMDLYYQYLNSGFHLPVVAGTDKMEDNIPMGSNRFYARTNGDKSYKAWMAAIKSGNGFITNGPLPEFRVNGHYPGEEVTFQGSVKVHAVLSVQSLLPFSTVEIVRNGWVVGHKRLYAGDNPPVDGIYKLNLETELVLDESSWIAARVADEQNYIQRILPRGLSVFAHTNPVYFLKDGKNVYEEASILYLQKYVKATINWLNTNPSFARPEDRTEALKLAEKAYGIYESLKK